MLSYNLLKKQSGYTAFLFVSQPEQEKTMKRLMSITATGGPSFDNGVVTIPLSKDNPRIYNRMASLMECLCSNGFYYDVDISMKSKNGNILILTPSAEQGGRASPKRFMSCEQLLAILDICNFRYHVELTPP